MCSLAVRNQLRQPRVREHRNDRCGKCARATAPSDACLSVQTRSRFREPLHDHQAQSNGKPPTVQGRARLTRTGPSRAGRRPRQWRQKSADKTNQGRGALPDGAATDVRMRRPLISWSVRVLQRAEAPAFMLSTARPDGALLVRYENEIAVLRRVEQLVLRRFAHLLWLRGSFL